MVRLKTRYMLVRLELPDTNKGKTGASKEPGRIKEFPTRKEMARATQDSIATCFGTSAGDAFMEIQVRLCDAASSLVLMRVSRENYSLVRASLTMMTSMSVAPVDNSAAGFTNRIGFDGMQQKHRRLPVVASVVSVHGSIRTAKKATMERIRIYYRGQVMESLKHHNDKKDANRELCAMEELLLKVQALD